MKLKAISNFWMRDSKRGIMIERKRGEEFDMDPFTEGEEIYLALGGRVIVIDDRFVPQKAEYLCLYFFTYWNSEGLLRSASPGKKISLNQSAASQHLASGYIKPTDENQWRPQRLLGPVVKEDKVKKMFDEIEPTPKENWAKKGVAR